MLNLSPEIAILRQHYQETFNQVKDVDFYRIYADEKIRHSLQVIGAGNFIIKHEKTFQNRSPDFIRCAVMAYLFHDIGRFQEIRDLYNEHLRTGQCPCKSPGIDHGLNGWEILKQMPFYADPRIIIPVKHHGHMIEDFYADPEYNSLSDEQLRRDIEQIIFLVRDADKIANLHLLKYDRQIFRDLFYREEQSLQKFCKLTPEPLEVFFSCQPVNRSLVVTQADRILNIIAWIFDLNYQPSFDFLLRFGCVDFLQEQLAKVNNERNLQEKIAKTLKNYISLKYKQFKEIS